MSVAEEYGFSFDSETCIKAPFAPFPCRKCLPCLLHRQKAWVSRLTEELRNHEHNYFVTLTYSDENVPSDKFGNLCFNKQHLIKLNKDLRKRLSEGRFTNPYFEDIIDSPKVFTFEPVKFKYYITSEYGPGGTHRPHYHGVWYGMPESIGLVELLFRFLWPYGFVQVYPAGDGAAGYISKYLVTDGVGKQSYISDKLMHPFSLMSKGLGLSYVDRMKDYHRADPYHRLYTQYHGSRGTMDRYLKSKIFDEETLKPLADDFTVKHDALREKYARFAVEHPILYYRLLEERDKYFSDMAESIRWNTLKKHSLK